MDDNQSDDFNISGIVEPVRRSVYDMILKNLKRAGRRTYLHRYIYFAEHKNIPETLPAWELLTKIVTDINADYCHEFLSGFMQVSDKYLIILIEGSEDALIKHFLRFFDEGDEIIGKAKLLASVHHINRRMFDVWDYQCVKPTMLIEPIDVDADYALTKHYINYILKNLYDLMNQLRVETPGEKTKVGTITPEMLLLLAESEVLDFLAESKFTLEVRNLNASYNVVPFVSFYTDKIWPCPHDYINYNIFDEEVNPIPYLPNQPIKKPELESLLQL